jgi:hypothetical protein
MKWPQTSLNVHSIFQKVYFIFLQMYKTFCYDKLLPIFSFYSVIVFFKENYVLEINFPYKINFHTLS